MLLSLVFNDITFVIRGVGKTLSICPARSMRARSQFYFPVSNAGTNRTVALQSALAEKGFL